MPRPAAGLPYWATDLNYPAGVEAFSATATKVAAVSGLRAQGWAPKSKPCAQTINHHLNLIGQWIEYFDGGVLANDLLIDNLHVNQTTQLDGTVDIGGAVDIDAALHVVEGVIFDFNLAVGGDATIAGDATIGDDLTVGGSIMHATEHLSQMCGVGYSAGGGVTPAGNGTLSVLAASTAEVHITGLPVKKRVLKFTVTGDDTGASAPVFTVYRRNPQNTQTLKAHTQSRIGGAGGPFEVELTVTVPFSLNVGESIAVHMAAVGGTTSFWSVWTHFDQVT